VWWTLVDVDVVDVDVVDVAVVDVAVVGMKKQQSLAISLEQKYRYLKFFN
jgi:hypothetical protein